MRFLLCQDSGLSVNIARTDPQSLSQTEMSRTLKSKCIAIGANQNTVQDFITNNNKEGLATYLQSLAKYTPERADALVSEAAFSSPDNEGSGSDPDNIKDAVNEALKIRGLNNINTIPNNFIEQIDSLQEALKNAKPDSAEYKYLEKKLDEISGHFTVLIDNALKNNNTNKYELLNTIAPFLEIIYKDDVGKIIDALVKDHQPPYGKDQIFRIQNNFAEIAKSANNKPEEMELFSVILTGSSEVIEAMITNLANTTEDIKSINVLIVGMAKAEFNITNEQNSKMLAALFKIDSNLAAKFFTKNHDLLSSIGTKFSREPWFNDKIREILINAGFSNGRVDRDHLEKLLSDPSVPPEAKKYILEILTKMEENLKEACDENRDSTDPATRDLADTIAENSAANKTTYSNLAKDPRFTEYKDLLNAAAAAADRAAQAARDLSAAIGRVLERPVVGPGAAASGAPENSGVLTTTPGSGGGVYPQSLTAGIEKLREAQSAQEFKEALLDVRAELNKLDDRIAENNEEANKLFALGLEERAQKKLENELAEQKAAVQALLELVELAVQLAGLPESTEPPPAGAAEQAETVRQTAAVAERSRSPEQAEPVPQTLEFLAELLNWIAPQLEKEIAGTDSALQRLTAEAERGGRYTAEGMRSFFKEQLTAQVNNYHTELELKNTEAATLLFDIFVELAFKPVVAGHYLGSIKDICIFIQQARTLAGSIELDETFERIADNNVKESAADFRRQLERISLLPALQIIKGWMTRLEYEAAEKLNRVQNTPSTREESKRLFAELNKCNLPGMVDIREKLPEAEKEYQKIEFEKQLSGMSIDRLAEILNFEGKDLPLDLRGLVKDILEKKITKQGALDGLSPEQLQRLASVLKGQGLSDLARIVQDALKEKQELQTTGRQTRAAA